MLYITTGKSSTGGGDYKLVIHAINTNKRLAEEEVVTLKEQSNILATTFAITPSEFEAWVGWHDGAGVDIVA